MYQDYLIDFEKNIKNTINKIIEEIKEFAEKSKVSKFVVGMSGGIDCAVTASLVKKAGLEVLAVTMPYEKDTSKQRVKGVSDAKKQCDVLGIDLVTVDITNAVNSLLAETNKLGLDLTSNLAKANILPRVRMTTVYFLAQNLNALVLGTGNLSEITMGYFTKWGDGGYDFDPIKEYTKTEIFILAKYLDIIDEIQTKKPSADLWDGQTDEEEMNITYEEIDKYIRFPLESTLEVREKVERAKLRSAHKRR